MELYREESLAVGEAVGGGPEAVHDRGLLAGVHQAGLIEVLDLDPTAKDPWGQPALRITHDWGPHDKAAGRWINDIKHQIAREMGAAEVWEAPLDPPYHITTHEHGGYVMGDDPTDSVVNSFSQSHEAPNLFVIGGGTFPTLSAYNPTATIQALAYRTAAYITREANAGGALAGTISRETVTV